MLALSLSDKFCCFGIFVFVFNFFVFVFNRFLFFCFSFVLVFIIFFVLILVFVNEFVIFSFFTIFVFVFVNENHTASYHRWRVVSSVPDDENLFHGNLADLPRGDPAGETTLTFCQCTMDISNITQCGRKAVSDTTADYSEPSIPVRLAVPLIRTTERRQANSDDDNQLYSNERLYSANIKYAASYYPHVPIGMFWIYW